VSGADVGGAAAADDDDDDGCGGGGDDDDDDDQRSFLAAVDSATNRAKSLQSAECDRSSRATLWLESVRA